MVGRRRDAVEPPPPPPPPPSRALYRGAGIGIGTFRCRPDHPSFRDSGPTRGHLVVFPREPVVITHAGRPPVIADPTVVMIYNQHQQYTRAALVPAGDRCEWFAFDAASILETRRAYGDCDDNEERPFGDLTRVPIDAQTYLMGTLSTSSTSRAQAHEIAGRERDGFNLDESWLQELCASLLDRVVRRACRTRPPVTRAHVELAEAARALIGQRFCEPLSLAELATTLGASPFHLARVFRAVTGETVHRHRTQLRVRAAIERIADGVPLTRLALELGFSSHSHFTHAFRAMCGATPSALRARS
jgi:AraC family transcriptional regulator